MPNVYLDTNVYIFGLLNPNSNSAIILDETKERDVVVVQSDYLFDEVIQWFRGHKGKEWAGKARTALITLPNTELIHHFEWSMFIHKCEERVDDEDDLPHICSYFAGNCEHFVTANRRLTQMKIKDEVKFFSPKQFVELVLELKGISTPYDI
jgi:predicted nucleic acid-binding protein